MDNEKKTFMLCFSAVIWKRIFSCLMVYSEYKEIDLTPDTILKCLKYNLLAPTGFVEKIKPYVIKALENGFLMPKDYGDNIYVKNAIHLFSEAHRITTIDDEEYRKKKEIEFIHSYTSKVFLDKDTENSKENSKEIGDLLNDIPEKNKQAFCDLVDVWDVELSLIVSEDPYFQLIKYYVLYPLNP